MFDIRFKMKRIFFRFKQWRMEHFLRKYRASDIIFHIACRDGLSMIAFPRGGVTKAEVVYKTKRITNGIIANTDNGIIRDPITGVYYTPLG